MNGACQSKTSPQNYGIRVCRAVIYIPLRRTPLAHLPQFAVENGQNIVGGWQKPLGYQPPFLENQM
jgi:hypothetical protein